MGICSQEAKFTGPEGEVGYVRVQANVKIQPRQEVVLIGCVQVGPGGHPYLGLLEPFPDPGLCLITQAIVMAEGRRAPIRVINLSDTPVYLHRYQKLGLISRVQLGLSHHHKEDQTNWSGAQQAKRDYLSAPRIDNQRQAQQLKMDHAPASRINQHHR
ncbi:hypothetical protein AAFF_G00335020 [Aldrovandia affinis]|uniref:dUTPase-like domain-containing protein n=1 Tax=Aldrovandia affinis TaxID=143900 RepID=A0AAD7WQI5_9TELE|nr:hypothetical protein AAFF_G00335020 [Aldrovandia affinis]